MRTKSLIAVDDFCVKHQIEISFITSLHQTGLIEVAFVEETAYIDASQLKKLEKIIRFYYDLDINLEGIETIQHLLYRMNAMQNEITTLRNRLRLYEDDF
jgi:hypothetical protein